MGNIQGSYYLAERHSCLQHAQGQATDRDKQDYISIWGKEQRNTRMFWGGPWRREIRIQRVRFDRNTGQRENSWHAYSLIKLCQYFQRGRRGRKRLEIRFFTNIYSTQQHTKLASPWQKCVWDQYISRMW